MHGLCITHENDSKCKNEFRKKILGIVRSKVLTQVLVMNQFNCYNHGK
jgi:hypothetical protein